MTISRRQPSVLRFIAVGFAVLAALTALPAISSPTSAATFANPAVPAAPWGVTAAAGANATVNVTWSAPFDGGATITDYVIQYSTDWQAWSAFNDGVSTTTSAVITGLTAGSAYHLRVGAKNSAGTGRWGYLGQGQLDVSNGNGCVSSPSGIECWGYNNSVYVGERSLNPSNWSLAGPPYRSAPDASIRKIVFGSGHSACALSNTRLVSCYGSGGQGVLGNGAGFYSELAGPRFDRPSGHYQTGTVVTSVDTPLTDVVDIASINGNVGRTCALTAAGAVYCWGYTRGGYATQVFGLDAPVMSISNNDCLVRAGGLAQCAGRDLLFQNPVRVSYNAIPYFENQSVYCAVLATGAVQCQGANDVGQLGNGTTGEISGAETVVGISNAVDIASTFTTSCALLLDGTVKCWGSTGQGELGNGQTTSASTIPVSVSGLSRITQIASGSGYYCAASADGDTKCWGRFAWMDGNGNPQGYVHASPVSISQSGNGSDSITPIASKPGAPTSLVATPGNGNASMAFTAGADGGAAITKYQYKIGNGSWTDAVGTNSPITVTGLTNGISHSIRLRAVNAVGAGAASPVVTFTPPRQAGPAVTSATPSGKTGIVVTFSLNPLPGTTVTFQSVVAYVRGTNTVAGSCRTYSRRTTCFIGGLTWATNYDLRVTAHLPVPGKTWHNTTFEGSILQVRTNG